MTKISRIITSAVLTAGLGLTGVVTASSSGAATPKAGHGTSTASHGRVTGPKVFCVWQSGPAAGKLSKTVAELDSGKFVRGKAVQGKFVQGKFVQERAVKGKVYVSGKQVPKGRPGLCPDLPPLPPLPAPGKGGPVCVIVKFEGPGQGKPSKTTVKVVNGKVYIDGKLAPKGKVNTKCPELPPLPAPGKPGKPGEPGGVIVGGVPGGGESGVTLGGVPGGTNESGVLVGGAPGGSESGTSTGALRG